MPKKPLTESITSWNLILYGETRPRKVGKLTLPDIMIYYEAIINHRSME